MRRLASCTAAYATLNSIAAACCGIFCAYVARTIQRAMALHLIPEIQGGTELEIGGYE
jgi:hypothetical protein